MKSKQLLNITQSVNRFLHPPVSNPLPCGAECVNLRYENFHLPTIVMLNGVKHLECIHVDVNEILRFAQDDKRERTINY